jgi:predicted nucleic acid-binding Zn ribbon protein
MATYVYRSRECVCPDIEVKHPISEDPDIRCGVHGVLMFRVPQATGIVLKGGGYYKTDSKAAAVGDPSKGIAPALPQEFGGDLNTRQR